MAAALDLATADAQLLRLYAKAGPGSDLRAYMVEAVRPSIQYPFRRYSVANDPVMSPPLLDEFCVRRTGMAAELDPRRLALLCSIYDSPRYRWVLPAPDRAMLAGVALRRHQRFSLRRKAHACGDGSHWSMEEVEVFLSGFSALACHGSAPPRGLRRSRAGGAWLEGGRLRAGQDAQAHGFGGRRPHGFRDRLLRRAVEGVRGGLGDRLRALRRAARRSVVRAADGMTGREAIQQTTRTDNHCVSGATEGDGEATDKSLPRASGARDRQLFRFP